MKEVMRKANIRCVYLVESSRRYYPYGNLAAAVLGFVNRDESGAYGLESYYNKLLAGTPGLAVGEKTALSGDMPYVKDKTYAPLTANRWFLPSMRGYKARWKDMSALPSESSMLKTVAVGIAIDVDTGAILGMTTSLTSTERPIDTKRSKCG